MGDFDEQLRQRLAAFQRHHGLSGDGVAGMLTWQRLMDGPLTRGGTGDTDGPGPRSASTDQSLTGFETGSAELTAEHITVIEALAADLNAHPLILGGHVTLTGFADRRGDEAANKDLGQRRAEAVRDRLQSLITDEETRSQIRAHSLGEPAEGPERADPNLRKVDITITRREYDFDLGPHKHEPITGAMPQVPPGPQVLWGGPQASGPPQPPALVPRSETFHGPDWFWRELPTKPLDPSWVSTLAGWVNRTLRTEDLADLAADMAGAFRMDRTRIRGMLEDAFQSGGEAGVLALLSEALRRTAGPPSRLPSSPTGPDVNPVPFPTPQLRTPEIRW